MCKPYNENNPYHRRDSFLFSDTYGYSLNMFRPGK